MGEFISVTTWVPRGLIHGTPDKVTLTREEIQAIINSRNGAIPSHCPRSSEESDMESGDDSIHEDPFDLENYDNDNEEGNPLGIDSLAMYSNRDNDAYINIPGMDDEDTDDEDDIIKPSDNLIICGIGSRNVNGLTQLEIHVYNKDDNDLYVHHDIELDDCPLSVEVIPNKNQDQTSAYVAVGSMSNVIELYDLNIMNPVSPCAKLGRKKVKNEMKCHSSSVQCLSWNQTYDHILASGSVDESVILWDLEASEASMVFDSFNGKIEFISWSNDPHCLLCCTSEKCIKLVDCRDSNEVKSWKVSGEALISNWNPNESRHFTVGTSKGRIYNFDLRTNEPIWKLKAHGCDISGLNYIEGYAGMLLSADTEGGLQIWNTALSCPRSVHSVSKNVENLMAMSFNPDYPYIGCLGGSLKKGKYFEVVNISNYGCVSQIWNSDK